MTSPQQQPDTWDAVAPTYAEDIKQWHHAVDEVLRTVSIGASDRVLDIACGPGTFAFSAARHAARVDAVDFSKGMIDEIRARAERESIQNIHGAVMDAQALDFPDATFDMAVCLFGFFFFPDRAKAFREMHRVLKPGGHALIATWSPIDKRPLMKVGFDAVADALPDLPRPGKGDLQDPDECVREMAAAGFRDAKARLFTITVPVESPEKYIEMIVRSGAPFAVMKKKIGPEAFSQAIAAVTEAARKRLVGIKELSAEAILTSAQR